MERQKERKNRKVTFLEDLITKIKDKNKRERLLNRIEKLENKFKPHRGYRNKQYTHIDSKTYSTPLIFFTFSSKGNGIKECIKGVRNILNEIKEHFGVSIDRGHDHYIGIPDQLKIIIKYLNEHLKFKKL